MCLRLVKYCWTSLGLLLEERSHGIDCLLREQSIFEITKTCVQITIRNAAPTKTCAYEIHFCGKAVSAKKDFPLFVWKCHYISIFVHILLVSTTLWSQKCSWEGRNGIFSCSALCLHKLVPHQFIHKSICVQTFVEFENSSFFLDFFSSAPSVTPAQPVTLAPDQWTAKICRFFWLIK